MVLADKLNVSPVVLARIILEKHCTDADGKPPSRSMLSQMMKDTATIDDPILADEVQLCVLEDAHYGPVVDSIRRSIGYEYEYKLQEILTSQGVVEAASDAAIAAGVRSRSLLPTTTSEMAGATRRQ
ncbi:PREDICTED: uncharacterized protein C15orf41 homolog [Priapulus caudatus]|uniref:CDAN1-interacting nuclease 1 n=1 Tax=Priapulus caudatus TaxID=37621 RepID=A0ABM1E2T1_PRICU|nr:PREDICTED: uncharacterized protein C15orf41 homolog [Priapulus caudatus]